MLFSEFTDLNEQYDTLVEDSFEIIVGNVDVLGLSGNFNDEGNVHVAKE